MPTVGEQLRTAREARKLRVQEVAEATNMRTDHVIALEEGNYAPFPAPVYIRGSVRTYAKLLQLDVMRIMDDLSAEMKQQGEAVQAAAGTGHRRGLLDFLALQMVRFGWKRSLIVILLLVVLALVLLFRRTHEAAPGPDPLGDLPPPAYQPAAGSDGGYLPLPGTNR
jgi:cytoskeletal protein RodZ